jgi:hypothetical protein
LTGLRSSQVITRVGRNIKWNLLTIRVDEANAPWV